MCSGVFGCVGVVASAVPVHNALYGGHAILNRSHSFSVSFPYTIHIIMRIAIYSAPAAPGVPCRCAIKLCARLSPFRVCSTFLHLPTTLPSPVAHLATSTSTLLHALLAFLYHYSEDEAGGRENTGIPPRGMVNCGNSYVGEKAGALPEKQLFRGQGRFVFLCLPRIPFSTYTPELSWRSCLMCAPLLAIALAFLRVAPTERVNDVHSAQLCAQHIVYYAGGIGVVENDAPSHSVDLQYRTILTWAFLLACDNTAACPHLMRYHHTTFCAHTHQKQPHLLPHAGWWDRKQAGGRFEQALGDQVWRAET